MIVKETWDQGMRKALSANGVYFYCLFNDFHGFLLIFIDFLMIFFVLLVFVFSAGLGSQILLALE